MPAARPVITCSGLSRHPAFLLLALAACLCGTPSPLLAHSVAVDGSSGEWFLIPTTTSNLARIARGAGEVGEYIWKDATGDERTDFSAPDTRVDLTFVRVTASLSELSFLIQVAGPFAPGMGAPMVQVAVDLDQAPGSGQTAMAGFADTNVMPEAAWEYLIQTRLGSGPPGDVHTVDESFTSMGTDLIGWNGGTGLIEFSVPWSRLGLAGPPTTTPIRFTIASFRSLSDDNTQDIGGGAMSNALDCVTNYGDPRTAGYPESFSEVNDQTIDYAFDVWLEADGDPRAPLLISEVLVDPPGAEPANEWIEIVNPTGVAQSLDGYRLGDEETPDAIEAMGRFPLGFMIPVSDVLLVASQASAFQALNGFLPDFEVTETNAAVPNLAPDLVWATTMQFVLANAGDEVLLLDRWHTIVDVVVFGGGGGAFPGVQAHPMTPEDVSHVRAPYDHDTDDGQVDFVNGLPPTPGIAFFPVPNLTANGFTIPTVRKGCVPFNAGFDVLCSGDEAGPFRVAVYLSTDASVTTTDLLLATQAFVGLADGGNVHVDIPITIPAGNAGQVYLGVIVDDLGAVAESDENDNVSWAGTFVPVPRVIDVADVRNDQGRNVRVSWLASSLDAENADPPILGYEVYRRIDPLPEPAFATGRSGPMSVQLVGWDYVASAPAHAESEYSVVVPTLGDSGDSGGSGVVRSVFMIRATTATPALFYDSCPDSGWSVDNIAPSAPQQLTGTFSGGSTALHWAPSPEPDFAFYRLHRGSSAGFVPSPGNLIAEPPDTGYVDGGGVSYYKLAAVDVNGNVSGYVLLTPTQTADSGDELPRALALGAAQPNPSRTAVAFSLGLPAATVVRAVVLDAAGRQMHELLARELPAGEHRLNWDLRAATGGRVASGRYFLRVSAGGHHLNRAFVVLD